MARPIHTFIDGTPALANEVNENFDEVWAYPNIYTATAGATINGATLPVPVYIDTADSKVKPCDADDTATLQFIGFAVTNSTDTNPIEVVTKGIVKGFTGLTVGRIYYVQNAVGTIGLTPGDNSVRVGYAISSTELMIDREKLSVLYYWDSTAVASRASGSGTVTTDTDTVVTLGFRPRIIRGIFAIAIPSANTTPPTVVSPNQIATGGTSPSDVARDGFWLNGTHMGYDILANSDGNSAVNQARITNAFGLVRRSSLSSIPARSTQASVASVTETTVTLRLTQQLSSGGPGADNTAGRIRAHLIIEE
jgi:hypothetical protein